MILFLNAYDTLGNVVLKKTDSTAKFTDTVVISDQRVVRIDYFPELFLLGKIISRTKARFLNTTLRKHIRRSLIKPPLMRRRKLLRGLRHVIRRAATSSIMPSRA